MLNKSLTNWTSPTIVPTEPGRLWRARSGRGVPMMYHRFALGLMATILLGIAVAGCNTVGQPIAPFAASPTGTVAFERIDGLPEGQFQ